MSVDYATRLLERALTGGSFACPYFNLFCSLYSVIELGVFKCHNIVFVIHVALLTVVLRVSAVLWAVLFVA